MIDISTYNKADVLRVLFNNARPQGLGFLHYKPEPMTLQTAEELLSKHTYFDYVQGRVMKVNLKGTELDPLLYDRDNGHGAAEAAIKTLDI